MNLRRLGAAVVYCDLDKQIFGRSFGVFDKHIEVAIIIENAGINQFVFHLLARATAVGLNLIGVGLLSRGVLVQVLQGRVRGGAVAREVMAYNLLRGD